MIISKMRYNIHQIPFRYFSKSTIDRGICKPVPLAFYTAEPKNSNVEEKSPVLIFHGMFGSKINWKSTSSQFAQLTKRKIYAIDLRNHGDSPHTSGEDTTLQCMAADVELFMNDKAINSAILLGHSLGGRVSSQFAFHYPERVEKLVLADISPLGKTPRAEFIDKTLFKKLRDSINVDLATEISMPEARKIVGERLMETIKNKFVVDFFLLSLYKNDKGRVCWKFSVDSLETMLMSRNITKIDIPNKFMGDTLLIHGSKSPFVGKEDYSSILEKVPNTSFICMQDVGHYLHVENPKEFMENVVHFIS